MCSVIWLVVVPLLIVAVVAPVYWYFCLKSTWKSSSRPIRTLIILGSGGHTTEMLRAMANLSPKKFSPRCYVVAETDVMSEAKVMRFEESLAEERESGSCGQFKVVKIPRSREVRQSYLTSVMTTLKSFANCLPVVWRFRPDLVLCNGPGTCVPVCVCTFLMRPWMGRNCSIVFMESLCRVETLSMTGLILYHLRMADEMFVQWPQLMNKYPRMKFIGRFV